MRDILRRATSIIRSLVSWPFIFIWALLYVLLYFLVTSSEDRRFERRGHDFKQSSRDKVKQYFVFIPADILGFYFPVIESVKLHLRGKTISRT